MLSQKVNKCPGWNHEIAIGWRSKNIKQNPTIYFMAIKSKIEQLSISIQPAYYIPNHVLTSRKICSL